MEGGKVSDLIKLDIERLARQYKNREIDYDEYENLLDDVQNKYKVNHNRFARYLREIEPAIVKEHANLSAITEETVEDLEGGRRCRKCGGLKRS